MTTRSSRRRGIVRNALYLINRAISILVWSSVLLLLLLLLRAGEASAGEMLLMLPVSGQNVSVAVANRVRALVIERLATHCQDCWIRDQPGAPTVWGMDGAVAVDLARSVGAQGILALNVGHEPRAGGAAGGPPVGEPGTVPRSSAGTTALTLTAYVWGPSRFPGGRTIQVLRATTAAPDAMRPEADGLVRELFTAAGVVLDEAQDYGGDHGGDYRGDYGGGIGAGGTTAGIRARRTRQFFVGMDAGAISLFGTPAGGSVALAHLGLVGMYLGAGSLIDAHAHMSTEGQKVVNSVALGIHHRWGERWFGGCVARWMWQRVGGRGASGPALQPTVGWLLPLGPSPVVRLDVGYAVSLFQERGTDRLIVGSGAAHRSHGPVATFGVAF